jgi:hypothetical protein
MNDRTVSGIPVRGSWTVLQRDGITDGVGRLCHGTRV